MEQASKGQIPGPPGLSYRYWSGTDSLWAALASEQGRSAAKHSEMNIGAVAARALPPFQGMRARSSAIPQKPVNPETHKPRPTKPASQINLPN